MTSVRRLTLPATDWCFTGSEGVVPPGTWSKANDQLLRHVVTVIPPIWLQRQASCPQIELCVCVVHGGTLRLCKGVTLPPTPHQLLLTTDTHIIASTQLTKHMHWGNGHQPYSVLCCKSMTETCFSVVLYVLNGRQLQYGIQISVIHLHSWS